MNTLTKPPRALVKVFLLQDKFQHAELLGQSGCTLDLLTDTAESTPESDGAVFSSFKKSEVSVYMWAPSEIKSII